MKRVPFPIIEAAKQCDAEAVEFIRRHFAGYIVNSSLKHYSDQYGNEKSYLDDELRYYAEIGMLSAIFTFDFIDPPDYYCPD